MKCNLLDTEPEIALNELTGAPYVTKILRNADILSSASTFVRVRGDIEAEHQNESCPTTCFYTKCTLQDAENLKRA